MTLELSKTLTPGGVGFTGGRSGAKVRAAAGSAAGVGRLVGASHIRAGHGLLVRPRDRNADVTYAEKQRLIYTLRKATDSVHQNVGPVGKERTYDQCVKDCGSGRSFEVFMYDLIHGAGALQPTMAGTP